MGPLARKLCSLLVLTAGFGLAGCENQALLQWFDNKPKLQGNRVPVFPEGVPGVQPGVPPELTKGYQSQIDQQAQAQAAAEEAQKAAEAERKRVQAERPKPQPQRVSQPRPPRQPVQQRAAQPQSQRVATEPAPPPQQSTSAPLADRWPSAQQEPPPQQQPPQRPQQSATTRPWPGSEPSGPPTDRFR
jgi:hypothetical protein